MHCRYIGLDFPKLSSMAAGQTVTCDLRNCTSGFFDRINEWSEKDTYHGGLGNRKWSVWNLRNCKICRDSKIFMMYLRPV